MKNTYALILLPLALSACGKLQHSVNVGLLSSSSTAHVPTESGNKFAIVKGQSNAQGTGQYPQLFGELDNLKYSGAHEGPIYYAGMLLAQRFPQWNLTLVDCTVGGAQLITFMPGNGHYEDCVSKVRELRESGAELIGEFFYQGESDARGFCTVEWPDMFTTLIDTERNDVDLSDMPVVFAQLGQLGNDPEKINQANWEKFKGLQAGVKIENVAMIKTADQDVIDDVHHAYWANEIIGDRFYRAYLTLIGK